MAEDSKPTGGAASTAAQNEQDSRREIRVHTNEDPNIVSVKMGAGQFIKGAVTEVGETTLKIKSGKNPDGTDQIIKVPKEAAQKMFPGQKFDSRELTDTTIREGQKTSIKQALDSYFKNTSIGNLDTLFKNPQHRPTLLALLSGKMSPLIHNRSIVDVKLKNEKGEYIKDEKGQIKTTGEKELKDYDSKIYLHRNNAGDISLKLEFKREHLDNKVYGVPLTDVQQEMLNMSVKDKNQKGQEYDYKPAIVIEAATNTGKKFKALVKLDKELNKYVTFPCDEQTEKRLLEKNEKLGIEQKAKEIVAKKQGQGQEQTQKQDQKQEQTQRQAPKQIYAPKNTPNTKKGMKV